MFYKIVDIFVNVILVELDGQSMNLFWNLQNPESYQPSSSQKTLTIKLSLWVENGPGQKKGEKLVLISLFASCSVLSKLY